MGFEKKPEFWEQFWQLIFLGWVGCDLLNPTALIFAIINSNLQVTIIKNLELYGLDPQSVANILQQKVQASATIAPVPGTKDRVQVQIQGNQIHHLAKMLLGKSVLDLDWL